MRWEILALSIRVHILFLLLLLLFFFIGHSKEVETSQHVFIRVLELHSQIKNKKESKKCGWHNLLEKNSCNELQLTEVIINT